MLRIIPNRTLDGKLDICSARLDSHQKLQVVIKPQSVCCALYRASISIEMGREDDILF